jgi:potassium-transporting ATPase KdpC subunit
MSKVMRILKPAVICFLIMTILCGVIYTAAVTGVTQLVFPQQANGSVITVTLKDGTKKDYGSALIAQTFTKSQYLIGRPDSGSATNLSAASDAETAAVKKRVAWLHSLDPTNKTAIPMDLVTASGSGVDPDISPEAADYQVARIARVRHMSQDAVKTIVSEYTTGRLLGFIGEPAVNVLKVNLALDGLL